MLIIESSAALLSALAVWFTARRIPLGWPIALVSVGMYAWIFIHYKLYSDALLQGLFGLLIIYGWRRWLKHLDATGKIQTTRLLARKASMHLVMGIIFALLLGYTMHRFTNAHVPWLDASLASASLVAQWWEAKRHTATWWLWIAVDIIYIGLYIYKGLYITALLYTLFILLAVQGLIIWRGAQLT